MLSVSCFSLSTPSHVLIGPEHLAVHVPGLGHGPGMGRTNQRLSEQQRNRYTCGTIAKGIRALPSSSTASGPSLLPGASEVEVHRDHQLQSYQVLHRNHKSCCLPVGSLEQCHYWSVVWLPFFIFPLILGILSSQLTFIFFRGVAQPPSSITSWS